MKNTISDLNNYLFETLKRLIDAETSEEMEKEISRSKAISTVAATIVHNGQLALDIMKHYDEYGYERDNLPIPIPTMLQVNKNE